MDPVENPYSPGAGRKPAALVGRDETLQMWGNSLRRAEKTRIDQPIVLYGLRGVGKTTLLAEFGRVARRRDWIVARLEAGAGRDLRQLLGEALYQPLSDLAQPGAGTRLLAALKTALSFKASYDTTGTWTFGLDLSGAKGGGADTGLLDTDVRKLIRDLSAAADEAGVGLAILIDESQDLTSAELATIATVAHEAVQDDWSVLFALAGLPSLPRILAEARSYSERFRYSRVEQLSDDAAFDALRLPSADEGVTWADDALSHVATASGRYPYFLQQFGQDTWNEASGTTIDLNAAKLGVAHGTNELDHGFFRARWDRATPGEQDYLRSMAVDGESGSSSGQVAARLGKTVSGTGPVRANLIAKGLIYAPEHGIVSFTVPGMASFIERHDKTH